MDEEMDTALTRAFDRGLLLSLFLCIFVALVAYAFGKEDGRYETMQEARELGFAIHVIETKTHKNLYEFVRHAPACEEK